jgi:hypothetical protein
MAGQSDQTMERAARNYSRPPTAQYAEREMERRNDTKDVMYPAVYQRSNKRIASDYKKYKAAESKTAPKKKRKSGRSRSR